MDKEARRKQSEADKAFHAQNRDHNEALAHGVFVNGLFYWLGIARPKQKNLPTPHHLKNNKKSNNTPNVKR